MKIIDHGSTEEQIAQLRFEAKCYRDTGGWHRAKELEARADALEKKPAVIPPANRSALPAASREGDLFG